MTRKFGNWNWQHYKPILAEKKITRQEFQEALNNVKIPWSWLQFHCLAMCMKSCKKKVLKKLNLPGVDIQNGGMERLTFFFPRIKFGFLPRIKLSFI